MRLWTNAHSGPSGSADPGRAGSRLPRQRRFPRTGKSGMPGFWDASALVPLCVPIHDPQHDRRLLHEHAPVVWWASDVEMRSAIARLRREKALTDRQHSAALQRLSILRKGWREIQPTNRLRDIAGSRLDLHNLRAGDALQ